jgi:hypothetical protein
VCQEEQPRAEAACVAHPAVIERGDDRLAGARGRDDEVAPAPVEAALRGEAVEDVLLEGVGAESDERQRGRSRVGAEAVTEA